MVVSSPLRQDGRAETLLSGGPLTIDDPVLPGRSVYLQVEAEDGPILVEAALVGGQEDEEVSARMLAFGEFTTALGSVTKSVTGAVMSGLGKVKPDKVAVEFGCELGVESGKLTAILVKGTAKATVKVTMEWKPGESETAE
ncbi:CU044_2847 family protein [Amycolatopsis japonica]